MYMSVSFIDLALGSLGIVIARREMYSSEPTTHNGINKGISQIKESNCF